MSLARISPEEMQPGAKYFRLAKKLLLVVLIIAMAILGLDIMYLAVTALVVLLLNVLIRKYLDHVVFLLFALVLIVSLDNTQAFLVLSVIMFVYGLLAGTLFAAQFPKLKILGIAKKLAINFVWFLLFFNLPLFLIYA